MSTKPLTAALLLAVAAPAVAQALPDRPIRRDEVTAAVARQFRAIDANHDGIVTRAEFDRYRASAAGQAAAASDDPFAHVGGRWFDHADPDGTGRVTPQMAAQHPLALFDEADTNRDGVLSPTELRVAEAMRSLSGH